MTAHVRRVSGSLVEVTGLVDVAMFDVVLLGADRLTGEVVEIDHHRVIVQAYETTDGLAPGAPVHPTGAPLMARLGPWLLGSVSDGLLRPLSDAGRWLTPGRSPEPGSGKSWSFHPTVREGEYVTPGDELGQVAVDSVLTWRVLVPPDTEGTIEFVCTAGERSADDIVATIGGTDVALAESWPVRRPRPYRERRTDVEVLHTGQRVVDLFYPLARGSSAAVPGGFGTGKTMLLQQIAKWCAADVIVYVGCGERGNEMADVLDDLGHLEDPRTGDRLSHRTVVIANTSNMPVMAREASIYTGITVAEYFRDMGYHAVLIADSTSRWAEALREFASRTGALPVEEGYPAGLASALAAFYERAGDIVGLGGRPGSVTVIGAVSPPGGDMTEPVTTHTQRFVRGVWTLDPDLAYGRHYPAVAWSGSYSLDAEFASAWYAREGDSGWARRRQRATTLLAEADRLTALADLVGLAAMPGPERMVMLAGRLLREAVLQQSALVDNDAYCSPAKGASLLDAVLQVVDRCDALVAAGVPAAAIEQSDFGPLVRAARETGSDDAVGVRSRTESMLAELGKLS